MADRLLKSALIRARQLGVLAIVIGGVTSIVTGGQALDEQGNSRYDWKDGRLETHSLIGHTWHGRWLQKENDRDGEFMVEFPPDFSEGEGRWWHSRIGADHAPTQKGGTFHLRKKTTLMDHRDTPPAP